QQPTDGDVSFDVMLTTQGRLEGVSEFEAITVRRGDQGQIVRLADVARVELGANTYALRSLLNNKYATAIPIIQAPGSNALAVSQAVRAKMEELSKKFPPGVSYDVVYDPTLFVRASIEAVIHTLLEAIILVVIVVIVFLQTWRATIIPLIAVPVSIIGTFAVMLPLGFSINALSLFGLVLAIGIVVDDAIVVVENVERNIADGKTPRAATRQAMREVSGPILATALVLCSVFIPTALISGLTGRFYQQFALTIAISSAISAFNSLTLSPALAALLLKPHKQGARPGGPLLGWFFAGFNRFFGAASRGYVGFTRRTIRLSAIALLLYGGLMALTWFAFQATPTGFVPSQDKGYLIAAAALPAGASLDRTEKVIRQVGDIAMSHPAVDGAVAFPGLSLFGGFANQSNTGVVFVRLKDYKHRTTPDLHALPTVGALQMRMFGEIGDGIVFCFPTPPIMGLGQTGDFTLYVEDRGNIGIQALQAAVDEVTAAAMQRPEFDMSKGGRVYSTFSLKVPRIAVTVDREKALAQGVRLNDIYDALQGYFGTIYANDFNRFGRTWQVNVQADATYRTSAGDFGRIKVRNQEGAMVPLTAFVSTTEVSGPDRAMHYNTYPAIDVKGQPAFGYSSDQAQAAIAAVMEEKLPAGADFEWTDLTYQQILAGNTAVYIFPICVLLVVLVLAAFYESMVLPLAIVLIVPMCLLCALGGVWASGYMTGVPADNNIMTQIGLIVLVGLACKNAILIVEFAKEAEVLKGLTPTEAALEACRLRLRPILMTSFAFILGVLPLVLAKGAGAELRHATGVAVFAGMIGVTIFGLVLTPVFYVVLRKLTGSKPFKRHDHDEDE
ncbi:MAG: efflux RND transporter permease subunit, partial [Planctomycetes bacterium]|nr:efflux RND transporter permease subunit [Planctomycetota bacterium]